MTNPLLEADNDPNKVAPIPQTSLFEKFAEVRAFVFDIDGVMTNAEVLVTENGELLRTMSVRDGQFIKYALQAGYPIGIITGGRSKGVLLRLQALGIQDIFTGIEDKTPSLMAFIRKYDLRPANVLYMGDDIPDVPVLKKVGMATCPQDACPEVLRICDYISPLKGGHGCVRDVLEKVMKIQKTNVQ